MLSWESLLFKGPLLCSDPKYYLVHAIFLLAALIALPLKQLRIVSLIVNFIPFLESVTTILPLPANLAVLFLSIGYGSEFAIFVPIAIVIGSYLAILRAVLFNSGVATNQKTLRLLTVACACAYFISHIAECNRSGHLGA